MAKWVLLIFGVLLLVSGAWGWFWLSRQVQPSEAHLAFEHLAEIPVSQIKREVTFEVVAPQSLAWERIRRSWGEPQYEVAVISAGVGPGYQYCLDGMKVRADIGGEPLTPEIGDELYGYSTALDSVQCHLRGLKFRIPQGTTATMRSVAVASQLPAETQLVVVPVWPYTKDKLVGLSIDQDLRSVAQWSVATGMFAVAVSAFLFARSKRNSPKSVRTPQ